MKEEYDEPITMGAIKGIAALVGGLGLVAWGMFKTPQQAVETLDKLAEKVLPSPKPTPVVEEVVEPQPLDEEIPVTNTVCSMCGGKATTYSICDQCLIDPMVCVLCGTENTDYKNTKCSHCSSKPATWIRFTGWKKIQKRKEEEELGNNPR